MDTLYGLLIIAAIIAFIIYRRHKRNTQAAISQGTIDIVGESHYQDALESIAGPKCEDGYDLPVEIELRREPDNPYDSDAIMCLIDGKLVGYINREDTHRLQPLLQKAERQGRKAQMAGRIAGGWSRDNGKDQGHYGVKLRID